jgi:hypothetical protein
MQVRRDSQHKFPGEGLFRQLAELGAIFEIVLYGTPERLFNFFNGFPLEGDDVTGIDYFTVEDFRVVIKLHMADVPFVFHHALPLLQLKICLKILPRPCLFLFAGGDDETSLEPR